MSTKERRSRQHYSPELKLKLVKMALAASEKGRSVAREYGINDNLLFKWIRLWQSESQVSRPRSKYRQNASPTLLPVQIASPPVIPTVEPVDTVCHARLRHGDITLHNLSTEILSLLLREMMTVGAS
ncbi:hypothetical protein B4907_22150 [Yersinia kristensenii]|nr:hypothetical protein B4907_22150 [Yersinia kristensenii]